ncbi:MAG: hypothetical protein V1917_01975 [Candidatus Gottesmanbacteria bacterium]
MNQSIFLHIIADYGTGDPSFAEVIQKLKGFDRTVECVTTGVPAFSTIATGFWTAQYALVNPIPDMVIYTNTAPRKDNKEKRHANEGEGLVYAILKNGVRVVGVNSGYCFSFIKPEINKLYYVNVANKGSQFRSRDFYPEAVIGIANGEKKWIGESISPSLIPDISEHKIAWIDGYGNMKTTTRMSSVKFQPGQPIMVTIGEMKRTAFYTNGSFSVREGELAFAPGSSGGNDRFMEIFLRGLSAWKEFGKPHIETEFSIAVQ